MNIQRVYQVLSYGWQHAGQINERIKTGELSLIKGRIRIFFDIISCYRRYSLWSNQYLKENFYNLSDFDREAIGERYKHDNVKKAEWTDYYYQNQVFFSKWSKQRYECGYKLSRKRNQAYAKQYHMGLNCEIRQDVLFISTHHVIGELKIGDGCLFGRGCDIDYTGGLIIGNKVWLSEGTKILTHNHSLDFLSHNGPSHGTIFTPLKINDRVAMGTRVIIMPGVEEIGRGAYISAGAVVRKKVPPYAIVMGNPSRIVGFRYTPDQVLEVEEDEYPIEERLSEEVLNENYKKYYLDKLQEIKQFIG